jgi:hypothetical protein
MPMTRVVQAALVLVPVSLTACSIDIQGGSNGLGASVREEKRFTVSAADPAEVRLRTFDGSIRVRSWDRNEVLVEIERRGPDQAAAEALKVNSSQDGNRIVVEAEEQRGDAGFSWSPREVSLTVTLPRRVRLEARTGDGSIDARDLTGDVNVDSGDGSIVVSTVEGRLRAHSGDGSIRVDGVDGDVEADSGDGSIDIAGRLSGLNVRTGDGTVRVEAAKGSAMKNDWRLTSGDGSITLRVPEGFNAAVDATTGDGSIRIAGVSDSQIDPERRSFQGQIGSGGATLHLRSGDGAIAVTR